MKKIFLIIISCLMLYYLYNTYELSACPACCKDACRNYEEVQKKKLTKIECENMIKECGDSWDRTFVKNRITVIQKIKKPLFNFKFFTQFKESYSLSAKDFFNEYFKNNDLTRKKYKNKLLKISGKIVDLIPEKGIISISYANYNNTITCNDVESSILNRLKKDQDIMLKGFFEKTYNSYGRITIFYFKRCVIDQK